MLSDLTLDARVTALLAIDLQHSNVTRQLAPYAADDVVARTVALADTLRDKGGLIVWVRIDVNQLLSLPADRPLTRAPGAPAMPPEASELVPALGLQRDDIVIVKRSWGAFHGTDLDLHLRRHRIQNVVMSGIATNFGVESTARAAFDRGYRVLFAEDAMSTIDAQMHSFALTSVFPHIGRVRSVAGLCESMK
ncbi:isochorismatase family protein [Chitinasiproducens palmae]|uniref:Nicotinamidase-related amidase n=1 Tax=Chitinasiproducens palmae TaxID=1770053 RepID=A0A1H2PUA5_9BURK|nr:isochorismatase family protein [Chitinasiproducens palmae]SDV50769.1 Nicotinamidase-related amidase [Chitinasiproducens palmae]